MCRESVDTPLSFRSLHSGSSGTNFPPTFPLFYCNSLSLNLPDSFLLLLLPPLVLLEKECPPPPACLKWPAHISQPFLAGYPPSSCLSLSFSLIPSLSHHPPSFCQLGGEGGEYLLTLFLFHTLTLFPYTQRTCSHTHTHTDDNVRCRHCTSTEEHQFHHWIVTYRQQRRC